MKLMALFEENEEWFNLDTFTTGPPDVVAAIKVRIKQLVGLATLQKLDLRMKAVMTVFLILSYLILSLWILVDTFIIYVVTTWLPYVRSQVTRRSTITARLSSS